MSKRLIWLCSITVAVSLGAAPVFAEKKKSRMLSGQAKLSMKRAEKTALARVPGLTKEIELERKQDGKLIFSVEIEQETGKEVEVEIDAVSGKVLKIEEEKDEDKPDENSEKRSEQ